jgi:hypothetical protein
VTDAPNLEQITEQRQLEDATRFLAELQKLDAPGFVDMIRAMLVIRDSNDPEALRLAAKCILRNQERLEEALDDARSDLESWKQRERYTV